MDLTKSIIPTEPEAVVAKEQHDPLPLQGSGVAAGGFPVEFETFILTDAGKWRKFSNDVLLGMRVKYVILSTMVIKSGDKYYCGGNSAWKKLEEKGDKRAWIHDLLIDMMTDVPSGWLNMPIRELIAI